MEPSIPRKATYSQDPIAVIGLACRLPGSCNSPDALWSFLEQGGVAHNEAPESRFNLKAHHDGSRKPKTMRSPGGMFLENIDPQDFDAQFFGIPRVEAIAMDPQQRQLLEVVYECLENAGISLEAFAGKPVGCFVGSYAVDYADMHCRDPEDRPPSVTVGVGRAILSNRISHFLDIRGPSFTIDTACSGSLVAVDVACRYLNTREITEAIVAASNLYLSPEHNMDEGAMKGAASPSGKCHTFDAKADGYIKAEGVNAVILKRLDDAIRDGDPIRAVIRGTATNSDGRTPGIASPSADAQATAIRAAYAHAGIHDVGATSYVECHGTGTPAGDPIEVAGLSSVFTESRLAEHPLIIGSIKSNIGHSEPAAGISGLLKAILSIEKGFIPGNPTFVTPNPKIDFEKLKVRVSKTTIPWPAVAFRRAGVNSFGYGGSNAHVILDDAKTFPQQSLRPHVSSFASNYDELFADDQATQPFTLIFSANDEHSLRAYCKVVCKHLVNPSVVLKLSDLSYTLSERRSRLFYRAYVVTDKTNLNEGAFIFGKKSTDPPNIGFVFTGQGAQWPQMGKGIIETFPVAKSLVEHLDRVLQALPNAPPWRLLNELVRPSSPDRLRIPEFSQPLATALQLAILAILESWGISPMAVVGHSSGEIAASCAAGLLTKEEAIKIAFFRGQACVHNPARPALGMLAVGLGPIQVQAYIGDMRNLVQVGCFNSPSSVTLSGDLQALEEIKSQLQRDGHFARMLQVDFAYHSVFMADSAISYEDMILRNCGPPPQGKEHIAMFSSVTGKRLDQACDANYWTTNMTSPVRFDEAVRDMISGREGANFLIEIGPSGALAGPIKQIQKSLGDSGSKIQYCAALSRGKNAIKSLFNVAGRLFICGGSVDLSKVNKAQHLDKAKPSVIVDLPNYVWNHSTKYWHESEASKDWRFRKFPHHDLLGSKILGTSWNAPSWKKTLRVENLNWLKDHRLGQEIVFPAAAFIAMGVEALYQARQATDFIEWSTLIDKYRYRLRNVTFPKALVLQEKGMGHKIIVALASHQDSWHEFKISSLTTEETWIEHSRGFVCLEEDPDRVAPKSALAPLTHPTPGRIWYKAMHDAGYNFGPVFQKHLEVESLSGTRKSRSLVSLSEPVEEYQQSSYPMHPVCIDGCLQTVGPSLWKGNRSSVDAVLIPAIIDSIIIKPATVRPEFGISVTSSEYVGVGRPESTKNYTSNASVYDPDTGALLFQVSGLRYHQLDVLQHQYGNHSYSQICWKPDITYLTDNKLLELPIDAQHGNPKHGSALLSRVSQLIDFIGHKRPNLKVLEVNMATGDLTSLWLDGRNFDKGSRAAYLEYHLAATDATTLVGAQEKYGAQRDTEFSLLDLTRRPNDLSLSTAGFDLVIVKMTSLPDVNTFSETGDAMKDIAMGDAPILVPSGLIASDGQTEHSITEDSRQHPAKRRKFDHSPAHSVQASPNLTPGSTTSTDRSSPTLNSTLGTPPADSESSYDSIDVQLGQKRKLTTTRLQTFSKARKERETAFASVAQNVYGQLRDEGYLLLIENEPSALNFGVGDVIHENESDLEGSLPVDTILERSGFCRKFNIQCEKLSVHLAEAVPKDASSLDSAHRVDLVHLRNTTDVTSKLRAALVQLGWQINEHFPPFPNLRPASTVLLLDELSSPVLSAVTSNQWQAIKELTSKANKLLWVTAGSQFEVSKPDNALIHGLLRTVRSEDPLLRLMTLDTQYSSGVETVTAIDQTLKYLEKAIHKWPIETELVERRGVLYISRVRPDEGTNQAEKNERNGADLRIQNLHENEKIVRLRCERLGTLDSLRYAEVSDKALPLRDHLVEVEIFAAGLNFKDLAVTMGIVPENEHLLGLEGAGVIRRVGNSVSSIKVGQRVLVYEKGTFANRIQVTPERVYRLPASMSFEDAATMPSVYLVAIYGLFHLANVQKNQRVLIHSASGGVGIAAIQLCQYIGAKIFATVGTDKKREFLTSTFGIPPEQIFSSRSIAFASQIMAITDGTGVDVILNSLTGNLLDESWRCISDGGTMIEIGKKDVLARNNLSMEPFNRNATYRGVDMSHKQISDSLIASLLSELMNLVEKGHVNPISPITVFSFEDIVSAFRYLRSGTHIGKVVISNSKKSNVELPVRPAVRTLALRPDASYLIVGGLRGLCGSLAVYLARIGAKHLAILCRSGYEDQKSQAVLKDIATEGCRVELFEGDVSNQEDVNRAFKGVTFPIRGVIQGAMVLRDKIYTSMTVREFHETIGCKVKGTWNLHTASLSQHNPLDFFTLLSSISGIIGQKGQANYAAANAFLDSFASYRRSMGLPASSVDLGVVEDVGYVAEHSTELHTSFDKDIWTPINEGLLHQILRVSILQQTTILNATSRSQLITGIAIPQPSTSSLLKRDPRFSSLYFGSASNSTQIAGSGNNDSESKQIRAFLLSLQSAQPAEHTSLLESVASILSAQFSSSLRLSEPMEPARPLASYGLDSLAAVEFRNWARLELGVDLTTLEIMGATSLFALGERIIAKIKVTVAEAACSKET